MFNWLTKLLNKPYTDAIAAVQSPASEYGPCVGEPVVSFLNSLNENPSRYRVRSASLADIAKVEGFVFYKWMADGNTSFYSMLDRKTGITYYARTGEDKVREVYGLPFNLNHYEMQAIKTGIIHRVGDSRSRLWRRECSRRELERKAQLAAEMGARLEFAKQFKE